MFHLNRLSTCDALDMPVLDGQAERHHIATADAGQLVPTGSRVAEEGAVESRVGEGTRRRTDLAFPRCQHEDMLCTDRIG